MLQISQAIKSRLDAAVRSQNPLERNILRTALGEIQLAESRKGEVSEDQAQALVRKIVDNNKETIVALDNRDGEGSRWAGILVNENEILESLLPKQMAKNEIEKFILECDQFQVIFGSDNNGKAIGMAMGAFKKAGIAVNGKDVATAVTLIRSRVAKME